MEGYMHRGQSLVSGQFAQARLHGRAVTQAGSGALLEGHEQDDGFR